MKLTFAIVLVLLSTTVSYAKAPCTYVQGQSSVVLTLNSRPQARVIVDLTSSSGRTLNVKFEPSADSPLTREVRLPGQPGENWSISAAGDRAAVATPDGKGSIFVSYMATADCASMAIPLQLHMLQIGLTVATWIAIADTEISLSVSPQAGALEDLGATSATIEMGSVGGARRGLDSAIPDALRETLSLLAEIAVDRAKAEGARIFKTRIQKYLCEQLTLKAVFGTISYGDQRLLPATCAQVENLRLNDLGASATGFIDALREDIADVVLPAVIGQLPAKLPPSVRFSSPTATAVFRIAAGAVRRGFTADSVKLAALSLLEIADIPAPLKRAIRVALQCARQQCSLGDIHALMDELTSEVLDAAQVPTSLRPVIDLAIDCATRTCAHADLKTLVDGLATKVTPADAARIPEPVKKALNVAVKCVAVAGGCKAKDVRLFIAELTPLVLSTTKVPTAMKPVVEFAVKCTVQTCTGADLTALAASLTVSVADAVEIPDSVRHALEIATRCSKSTCTASDVKAFLREFSPLDPFWIDAALRLANILQPRPNADASKLGGELVDLLLDVVKQQCKSDRKCEIVANSIRDITVGVIEADYLRALGGVQGVFTATSLGEKLEGKPLELAASIASYVSTYRETKDKDAAQARELRKKALEGLIDAGTDRTNRGRAVIVSLGASVGFTGGWRRLDTPPATTVDSTQRLLDLRLPMGITVQRIPTADSRTGFGFYGMFSFVDVAQFVGSPVTASQTDPNTMVTTTTTVDPVIRWSDIVALELQAGARFGSDRIPLTIGFDLYYRPRVGFETASGTETTSVRYFGGFVGFNVPFFDLN